VSKPTNIACNPEAVNLTSIPSACLPEVNTKIQQLNNIAHDGK
jgi:hypothetical protein